MGSLLTETYSWKALRAPAETLPHISIKLYIIIGRLVTSQGTVPVLTETRDCHTLLEMDAGQRGTDRGWGIPVDTHSGSMAWIRLLHPEVWTGTERWAVQP